MTPDVEDVIRAARAGEVGAPELFRALSEATLLLATKAGEDGSMLPYVFSWNDADHGAVFTSQPLTAALPAAPGFTELAGRELGRRWPDGLRAVINPGSTDVALVFDDAAMHLMASPEQAVREPAAPEQPQRRSGLSAGEQVAVGVPATAPAAEFVGAVRAAVQSTPGVQAGYIFQMVDGTQTARLVVGVVLAPGADEPSAVVGLADATTARHAPAADLDFMVLDDELLTLVAGQVRPIA